VSEPETTTPSTASSPNAPRAESVKQDQTPPSHAGDARTQYLIECFKLSHEEGMMRIRKRDNLLMMGLVAQVVIAALANQVEMFEIKAPTNFTIPAIFSSTIALVLCALYAIQNNAIGYLSDYVASLSKREQELNGGAIINNWDASPRYRSRYIGSSILSRYIVPIIAFFLLPVANYVGFGSGFRIMGWYYKSYPMYIDIINMICLAFVLLTIRATVSIRIRNSTKILVGD
jgi:hypothetical protein